jgi:parallel beta-helix repeat protein
MDTTLQLVNMKELGAKGDGVTDDSSVFQGALDMAKQLDGIRIFIPAGDYRLTKELIIHENTAILADPKARIIRDHSNYILINGYKNSQTEQPPSMYTRYNGAGHITIKGGVWDGNGTNQSRKASIFHIGHSHDIRIKGATFKDVSNSHHIEFNACQNVWVQDCSFLGYVGTDNFNEAIQLDLSKRRVTILGVDDDTPCRNVWIENCHFGDSGTPGANHIARAVGSHTATIGVYHENIHILNNVVENSISFAFRAYAWKNVTISHNQMINCGAGINWRTNMVKNPLDHNTENTSGVQTGKSQVVENGTISDNNFSGGMDKGRAIEIYGESSGRAKGISVTGNNVTLSPSTSINDAILLHYAQDCTVTGNRVYGAGKNGISCRNTISITVSGNVIDTVGDQGISVSGSSAHTNLSGNMIKRTGKNGIYVTEADTCTISGNTTVGVNGERNDSLYAHFRLTSNVDRIAISGNTCRNYGSSYVAANALTITSGTNIVRAGNNFAGFNVNGVSGMDTGADLL